ncbi:MAG: phosphomannomutase CpsG [Pseudomonadales bacterium]|nr:phosphomannomutase CpsG [Pseudomonadales bacterium]
MSNELTCFKAYDIRGRVPDQLNEDIAYRIGRAYAQFLKPKKVIVGHDIRLTSVSICDALVKGLMDSGVDVYDIGECGTEEVYFATFDYEFDGGIVVTASHNPKDYNGMKLVRELSKPISGDTGLNEIKELAEKGEFDSSEREGEYFTLKHRDRYIPHLLSYVDIKQIKPLTIVVNAGNGGAGAVIDRLEPLLPIEFIKLHHEADGNFPHGVPNPLLSENRTATIEAIKTNNADLGIAWDGDFDRCFFFDENGNFIEGYYIVGLLAEAFLAKHPGSKVVHDPRLTWNTIDIVEKYDGQAVQSKTGHAFIKERMRLEDAIYGGEMSAHHYFRDFSYCDSGMIPWLLVIELITASGKPLSALVADRMAKYPCSGEINKTIEDPQAVIEKVKNHYTIDSANVDLTDGLSMTFDDWRFNLRMSNTEPVVRLNVESRGNQKLMEQKTKELLTLMGC